MISIAFNYCFAILWITEYGEREGMKRFLADYDGRRSMPRRRDRREEEEISR